LSYQIENTGVDGAFDPYVGGQKCIQDFGRNLKERDHLEEL